MRNFLIISTFLLVCVSATAQRIKYKDLVPMLDSAKEDQAIPMLNELLQIERDNPNANFRLGMLYASKYKSTDPLKQFEMAMEYADRAKLQMVKSKAVIDNREVNRNREWYVSVMPINSGARVEFAGVQQVMDNEYNLADEFSNAIPPAYNSFTKAVLNYDKAKKIYAEIAEEYSSLKELYLLYDESLESKLKDLQLLYDSTHFYFNEYKTLKEGTTIPHDQELVVKEIAVYRKDGLTIQTNFFNPSIEIWNYKAWASKVIGEVGSTVQNLRSSLQSNYEKLVASVEAIRSGKEDTEFETIDKELLFNLGRMDYQNAIIPLLEYKQFLQEYLTRKNELSGLESDTAINVQTKLQLYTILLYESIQADSILTDLIAKSEDIDKLSRHSEFLTRNFGNIQEFKEMAGAEISTTASDYDSFVGLIKNSVTSLAEAEAETENTAKFQRLDFPLFAEDFNIDSLESNKPITTHVEHNADGSIYLAGVVIRNTKNQNVEAFAGKADANLKILWMKFYNLDIDDNKSLANHQPTAIRATQKGLLVAINSAKVDTALSINNLVYISDAGEELLSVRVDKAGSAHFINYQEEDRSFIITYYNTKEADSNFDVLNVSDTGSVIWEKQMLFSGEINQVFNVYQGIVLVGTSTYWKSEKSELRKNSPALFLAKFDLSGNIKEEKMVDSFRLEKAYKVNDRNLSLMNSLSSAELPPGSTNFVITNSSLELIYPRKK